MTKFYQIRACGVGEICKDDDDRVAVINIIKSSTKANDSVQTIAYCVRPDHFVLLMSVTDDAGLKKYVEGIIEAYDDYYCQKYHTNDDVLIEPRCEYRLLKNKDILKTSALIHLESKDWADCEFTSIRSYLYDDQPEWVDKKPLKKLYKNASNYYEIVNSNT